MMSGFPDGSSAAPADGASELFKVAPTPIGPHVLSLGLPLTPTPPPSLDLSPLASVTSSPPAASVSVPVSARVITAFQRSGVISPC